MPANQDICVLKLPQALLAKSVLVTVAVELLQSGPQMQELWYISQPCCSVDVYVGLCVSSMCVKDILDFYLPVYQAAASSLRMSSVPGPRASLSQCGRARCCSSVCICSQTYWQTKKVKKKKKERFEPHFWHYLPSYVFISWCSLPTRTESLVSIKDSTPWICGLNSKTL